MAVVVSRCSVQARIAINDCTGGQLPAKAEAAVQDYSDVVQLMEEDGAATGTCACEASAALRPACFGDCQKEPLTIPVCSFGVRWREKRLHSGGRTKRNGRQLCRSSKHASLLDAGCSVYF